MHWRLKFSKSSSVRSNRRLLPNNRSKSRVLTSEENFNPSIFLIIFKFCMYFSRETFARSFSLLLLVLIFLSLQAKSMARIGVYASHWGRNMHKMNSNRTDTMIAIPLGKQSLSVLLAAVILLLARSQCDLQQSSAACSYIPVRPVLAWRSLLCERLRI